MKIKMSLLALLFIIGTTAADAQHVRVRVNFPVGIGMNAPGRAPFTGAIWVGPEWTWRGGRYECVPGYWARPNRHGAIWIPGYWKQTRFGYKWVPGRWR